VPSSAIGSVFESKLGSVLWSAYPSRLGVSSCAIGSILESVLGSVLESVLRAYLGACNEVHLAVLLNAA